MLDHLRFGPQDDLFLAVHQSTGGDLTGLPQSNVFPAQAEYVLAGSETENAVLGRAMSGEEMCSADEALACESALMRTGGAEFHSLAGGTSVELLAGYLLVSALTGLQQVKQRLPGNPTLVAQPA
jgi:hypothetical protein